MKKQVVLIVIIALFGFQAGIAQELNFAVKINIQKLQTVDPGVFQTLEASMNEFLNNQKWTSDIFEPEERINCNLQLTIQEELSPTSFKAEIAIQAARAVYNSSYESTLLNHIDKDVTFVYEQYQPLIFSRNTYNDNLSQILAFYCYVILGMDYDSFSPFGGEEYFQEAQQILNSVPEGVAAGNPGWRSLDGPRNRFWMIENILSPRVRPWRQGMYDYHRQAMDILTEDITASYAIMAQAIEEVGRVNQTYPNSMIVQMFSNAKSSEIVEVFKRADRSTQDRVIRTMTRVDAANAAKYRGMK